VVSLAVLLCKLLVNQVHMEASHLPHLTDSTADMASTAIMDERSGLKHFERDNPMAHSKPTFVLVHGGWQGPSLWTYVIPLLERAGYATYPVTLVSPDSDPPVEDFTADVEVVRRAVDTLLECGKDVILVLFSYAGYVGCEALKSFHDEQSTPPQNTGLDGGVDKKSAKKTDLPSWFARPRRGKILHIAFIASYIVAPGMTLWSPRKGDSLPGMENKVSICKVHVIHYDRHIVRSKGPIDTTARTNSENRTEWCAFWMGQIVSSATCRGRLLSSGPQSSGVSL